MASPLILTLTPSRLLSALSKLRPVGCSSHETCLSVNSLEDTYDDYVSSQLKTLAPNDKTIRQLISLFETEKKIPEEEKRFEAIKRGHLGRGDDTLNTPVDGGVDGGEDSGSDDEEGEPQTQVCLPVDVLATKAEILQLEAQSLKLKLWLRRIQFIRREDKKKYNGLQDFEHAIYCAQEVVNEYRDLILNQFQLDREGFEVIALYHEDRLKNSLSKALEEKEKANFEMLVEDAMRFLSYKDRISSLLGLQLDFLDRLDEIPPEDRDHLAVRDWIVNFIHNNYKTVRPSSKRLSSKELLASIGFDPLSPALETIMARGGNTQQHIDVCDMATIFILDEFKYNILLSPVVPRFPLQSSLTDEWFNLPEQASDEDNCEVCHVNIKNLVIEESLELRSDIITRSEVRHLLSKDDQNIVLFHGTDHLSAYNILFRGINLCHGRPKRDFSCGSGFYLTNNSDEALNWAKSTTAKPALLVFQVNRKEYLDGAAKLNLFENEQRWREIVSSFRSRKRTARTRKSLRAYDLIEGPVGVMRRDESTDDEIVFDPKPSSYQMCLISDDFADTFRETLHSILFLEMN